MKRLLLIIGVIMTFTISVPRASAATPALSPEVNLVIERAQAAVDDALNSSELEDYFFAFFGFADWIREALSTTFAEIDTRYRVVRQGQSLTEHTACFRYDQWLLEQLLDGIRYQIDRALEERDVFAILRLQEAYGFVSNHLEALVAGGTNPELEDTAWAVPLTIEGDEAPEPEQLCLFNSDYTPPSVSGYGCDSETIDRILAQMPSDAAEVLGQPIAPTAIRTDTTPMRQVLDRERGAVLQAQRLSESQRRLQQGFVAFQPGVDQVLAGDTPATPELPERVHMSPVHGCVDALPSGVILKARRTPFSTDPDEWSLLLGFWQLWRNAALQRPAPSYVATPKDMNILTALGNATEQIQLRDIGVQQAEWEAATFAAGADPGLATEDTFAELRAAVSLLVKLGNSLEAGLRGFVRDFASWLDRSCVNRPCGSRLTTVLKLVFTDECFPYGNGTYMTASDSNPQWRQCLCTADPTAPDC